MSPGHDFAVIGGGLIGSAIAWGAARTGASVILLDEGDMGRGASLGNFGLVWLQGKGLGSPGYMSWSLRAGRLWPEFARILGEETGINIGWRSSGGLYFCLSESDMQARQDMIARTREQGGEIDIRLLDRDALKELAPGIGADVVGASFSDRDGEANPMLTVRALRLGLLRHSGEICLSFVARHIRPDDQAGFRIVAGDGRQITARRLAICAGLGGMALAAEVGIDLPLTPERGHILVTERLPPFLHHPGNVIRQTREGTVLLGSSHDDAGYSTDTDVATIAHLCHIGTRVFPAIGEARLMRAWSALRVMTPDKLPVYDTSPRYPDAFVITSHSAVTLASIHALEIGPALAAGSLGPAPENLGSSRFEVHTD